MVEGDHDGDSASITIELLNVIEKLMLFFLPATKCFKYRFTVIRRTLFNGPIFIFSASKSSRSSMNSDVLCRIL